MQIYVVTITVSTAGVQQYTTVNTTPKLTETIEVQVEAESVYQAAMQAAAHLSADR